MANRFLVSVAALALIGAAGLANAQGTGGRETGGSSMQNSPSSSGGSMGGSATESKSGRSPGMTEQKSHGTVGQGTAGQNERAEEKTPGTKSKGMRSANEMKGGAKEKNAQGERRTNEMNAQGQRRTDEKNAQGERRTNEMNAQGERRGNEMNAERGGTDRSHMTTGQAGAGAKLSTDQRTRITTIIRNEHVSPVTSVDFPVSVGTRVPRERVSLRALPSEVVSVYPEWRGYEFFVVHNQIVVVDPRTLEIVDVIES